MSRVAMKLKGRETERERERHFDYLLVPIFSMAEGGGPINSTPLD